MASGKINSSYVLETIAYTKATTKIPDGDYGFSLKRCGNVIEIAGWFHNTTQITDGETLFTFPYMELAGGFCPVVKGTSTGVCEYRKTSFVSRSTLAVGYWNITTLHIFVN